MTLNKGTEENKKATDEADCEEIGVNLTIAQMREMLPSIVNIKTATLVSRLRQNGIRPTMKCSGPSVYETQALTQEKLQEVFAHRPPKPKDSIESLGGLDAYNAHLSCQAVQSTPHSVYYGMRKNKKGDLVRNI